MCVMVCPFGVITRNTEGKKIASKCDLCIGANPVCVKNCPNEAITYEEKKEMNYVIIGNSVAGIANIEAIREYDKTGKITVISDNLILILTPLISYFLANKVSIKIYITAIKISIQIIMLSCY